MTRAITPFILLSITLLLTLTLSFDVTLPQQWQLLSKQTMPVSFDDYQFLYGHLPRICMSIIVGAVLGFVGSLMQQVTQNPLTSPLTLGTSSGAWLALIIMNIWFTEWIADYASIAALFGAISAFFLTIGIVGLQNMSGLPIVVAGMVVNILLGAIATGIILLNNQFAQNVFMWGAGDLAQNGWDKLYALLPKLVVIIPLFVLAPRALTLLKLGNDGAASRGLALLPTFFCLMFGGIWLASSVITYVGIIGFIGLISPNITRAMGVRGAQQELLGSLIVGALLLLITDRIAFSLTQYTTTVVPSGVTTALIGAPALVWFSRKRLQAQDSIAFIFPQGATRLSTLSKTLILTSFVIVLCLYGFSSHSNGHLAFAWPEAFQWQVRGPRLFASLGAGMALAAAGVILQRLIYNPLASPDILGISSGATFALVFASVVLESSSMSNNWGIGLSGSLLVLITLLLLAKRQQFAPSSLILTGIATTALLDALIQFCLAKGTEDTYRIMVWLSGSTYRVHWHESIMLIVLSTLLIMIALCCSRWLTQLSIGRQFAESRGVPLSFASIGLLIIVALLCALSTSVVGPLAFIGLISPHLAMMIGAKQSHSQLLCAVMLGGTLMLWADWLGQNLLYPNQLAAGTLVSILGGGYFIFILLKARFRRS